MVIVSVLTVAHDASTALIVTGFAAAAMWLVASIICLRIYYKDNRVEIKAKAMEIVEDKCSMNPDWRMISD